MYEIKAQSVALTPIVKLQLSTRLAGWVVVEAKVTDLVAGMTFVCIPAPFGRTIDTMERVTCSLRAKKGEMSKLGI
jgi:hypothetical protein